MLHWLLRKRVPGNNPADSYHRGELFSPGVQNFVYESGYTLPLENVTGSGNLYAKSLSPIAAPLFLAGHSVPTFAPRGNPAGQLYQQGLLDNPDL